MSIQNRGKLSTFIRGGDTLAHRLQLLLKNAKRSALIFSAVMILVWAALIAINATPKQRDLIYLNHISKFADTVFIGRIFKLNVSVRDDNGNVLFSKPHVRAHEVAELVSNEYTKRASVLFWTTGVLSIFAGLVAIGAALYFQVRYGKSIAEDERIRGQELVSAEELRQLVMENEPSDFYLGEVPIPLKKLARCIALVGSMGGGKSQAMGHLLDAAAHRRMRMVVYDQAGEFVSSFYRPGKDFLLNPLDQRCANWQVFNDLVNTFDYYALACFFVPLPKDGKESPIWVNSARTLLADLFMIVNTGKAGPKTMRNVYHLGVQSSLEDLAKLLREYGVASSGQIKENNDRGSESIRMTLADAIKFFPFIRDSEPGYKPFSIRDWMHNGDADSRLFLTSREDMHETMKPYLSMWLQLALMAAMTREVRHAGHPDLFLSLDEVASLGKIEALDTVLTRGRRFGILTAIGMQNLAQFDVEYEHDLTKVLISNLRSKLIFAVDEFSSAERLADLLGKEDVEEKSEGTSYGVESQRDGLNISSKRSERHVVMPIEITKLEDLEAYVKIPGNYPIAKVHVPFKVRPKLEPLFVMREGLTIAEAQAAAQSRANVTVANATVADSTIGLDDIPEVGPGRDDDTYDRQQEQDYFSL